MQSDLKGIFSDICRGYSEGTFRGKKIYFKHLTVLDRAALDRVYEDSLARNLDLGLNSREDLLKEAYELGTWSAEKEAALKTAIQTYERFSFSRSKSKNIEAAKGIVEGLKNYEEQIQKIQNEKDLLLVQSAEEFAMEESLERQINISSFADPALTIPFFDQSSFEYLRSESSYDFHTLRNLFVDSLNSISSKTLRLISIQFFFQDIFSIYKEAPNQFFDKPAFMLTELQILLLRLGKYFHGVIELCDGNILKERNDPDVLESYAIIKNNADKEN